jgi:hypothetical protein
MFLSYCTSFFNQKCLNGTDEPPPLLVASTHGVALALVLSDNNKKVRFAF